MYESYFKYINIPFLIITILILIISIFAFIKIIKQRKDNNLNTKEKIIITMLAIIILISIFVTIYEILYSPAYNMMEQMDKY